MMPQDRLIVALDVASEEEALAAVRALKKSTRFFKVGFELFSSCGPSVIAKIRKAGCEIFLDLKFHDIPNTVARAARSVTRLGVYMFNVHASGGLDMMKAAAVACAEEAKAVKKAKPKILAVTVLTSMDENALKKTGIDDNISSQVARLAKLAKDAGLDGVVASPQEASLIREAMGKEFIIVTPGVRPAFAAADDPSAGSGSVPSLSRDDQKRVATPKEAIAAGADFIVVGRPILEADDPVKAAQDIIREIK
jgi:orotidine-5'-phosphate decarboxylase